MLDSECWTLNAGLWTLDLTICQTCLPCPPSGWIRLNIGASWAREKPLVQWLKEEYVQGQSCTVVVASENHWNLMKFVMVVVTPKSHRRSLCLIPRRSQIYSPLLPRNWRVKTMRGWGGGGGGGEGDHKVACRWHQLTISEWGKLT